MLLLIAAYNSVINNSAYLAQKYVSPIGAVGLTSKNFESDHVWFQNDGAQFVNPYKLLPSLFEGWTADQLDSAISEMDSIADGGAALTAYSKLQFTDMWILRFDLCQSFRSDGASYYGSNDATLVV